LTTINSQSSEADRLEALIREARPLLKDMQSAIRFAKEMKSDYLKLSEMANMKLKEAIEEYRVIKDVSKALDERMESLLESLEIIQMETKKLERLKVMYNKHEQ
jgi:hypothetical protein